MIRRKISRWARTGTRGSCVAPSPISRVFAELMHSLCNCPRGDRITEHFDWFKWEFNESTLMRLQDVPGSRRILGANHITNANRVCARKHTHTHTLTETRRVTLRAVCLNSCVAVTFWSTINLATHLATVGAEWGHSVSWCFIAGWNTVNQARPLY